MFDKAQVPQLEDFDNATAAANLVYLCESMHFSKIPAGGAEQSTEAVK